MNKLDLIRQILGTTEDATIIATDCGGLLAITGGGTNQSRPLKGDMIASEITITPNTAKSILRASKHSIHLEKTVISFTKSSITILDNYGNEVDSVTMDLARAEKWQKLLAKLEKES